MKYRRLLKYKIPLMSGDDVRYIKDKLFEWGYFSPDIKAIRKDTFGKDTRDAVLAFQKREHLAADGIVGHITWNAVERISSGKKAETRDYVSEKEYPNISTSKRKDINNALQEVSEQRRNMVLEALKYAHDPATAHRYPTSFYIRGGNLFNTDLKPNIISMSYLTGAYYKRYRAYCTNGRLEMMEKALKANPQTTGADCSGGIVGLLRKFKLVGKSFDQTANSLCGSGYSVGVKVGETTAGDFVGKSGHIGLYAGGGWVIEWAGGEYGCQITSKTKRQLWSFTKNRRCNLSSWNKWRNPKFY